MEPCSGHPPEVGALRIGCSGWVYRDWRGVLYPPKLPQRSWLARYAEVFDTVASRGVHMP